MFKITTVGVQDVYEYDAIDLFFRQDLYSGKAAYVTDVTMTEYDPHVNDLDRLPPSPLRLTHEAAQMLMDRLWNVGIRPTEGAGSAGAMRQAEDHIATLKQECERLYALLKDEGDAHPVGV